MEYPTEWVCTDPDTNQYGRQIAPRIFEFKDEISQSEIDLDDYTEEQILSDISSFGYNSWEDLVKEYGDEAEWVAAECIFELEN